MTQSGGKVKAKPGAITFLALLQILSPIGNIWFGALLSNSHFFAYLKLLRTYDPYFIWSYLWIPLIAAIAIYSTKILSLPVFFGTLIWHFSRVQLSTVVGASLFIKLVPFIAIAINFFLFLYFCFPQVRKVYLDRRARWWESTPRYLVNLDCSLVNKDGIEPVQTQMTFFSIFGVFLVLPEASLSSLNLGDVRNINFKFKNSTFSAEAKAVNRLATSQNQIGFTFINLTILQKLQLWYFSNVLEYSNTERRPERVSHFAEMLNWATGIFK